MNIFNQELPEEIHIKLDERNGLTNTRKYIHAKTVQLREFGYNDLSLETVAEELSKILNRKKLTVIGLIMEDEIVISQEARKK